MSYVARVSAATGAVERLTSGRRTATAIAAGPAGGLALLAGTAGEPDEVYALENGALRRLSRENDGWLSDVQLPAVEDFTCTAKDGTVVNGLVWKPAGFDAGKKYPLLLRIHGGPNGQDAHEFDFERELFAANGYVVLAVNYRGSSGRGAAFQKAIFADWGNKEVVDLLAGVDQVDRAAASPTRIGWASAAGATAASSPTTRSPPTTRFKAAMSGAGSAAAVRRCTAPTSTSRSTTTSSGRRGRSRDVWLKISYPFFHADRIKTPTLFLGGDKDFNVPIAGGEQMYQALKSLNVESQLVVYPDQHHILTIPSYVRDRYARSLGWYDRFLKK